MNNSKLSVQLYTVRDGVAADLSSALNRIAAIGYSAVELFDFVDSVDEYARLLPALGLASPSAHAQLLDEDVTRVFEAAQKLGITTVIDPFIDPEKWREEADIVDSAKKLNAIADQAGAYGLTVGYHNHWWETENRVNGATALEYFASHLNSSVILEVDTYWAEVGGVSAAELLLELGERVRLIHVKDGPVNQNMDDQVAVGSGDLDIRRILKSAPEARRVVELDAYRGDIFEALQSSYDYLAANDDD